MKFSKSINCVSITWIKIKNISVFAENSWDRLLNLLEGHPDQKPESDIYLVHFSLLPSQPNMILHFLAIPALCDLIQALIIPTATLASN